MSRFTAAFKRELESPSVLIKEGGLWSTFAKTTSSMGPALAIGGTAPDLIGSYQSYKAMKDDDIEDQTPQFDERGMPIDPEIRRRMKKKKKREAAGGVGEGIGSAVGSLAGFLIPGGPLIAIPGMLASGWLGRKAGRAVGESSV